MFIVVHQGRGSTASNAMVIPHKAMMVQGRGWKKENYGGKGKLKANKECDISFLLKEDIVECVKGVEDC